jgi:hypothetical protein
VASNALQEIADLSAREHARIAASRGKEPPMATPPDKALALREATGALEALGCPWALIGGVAVGLRSGVPRATIDTDLAVSSRIARSTVIDAFVAAGFVLRGEFAHSVNFRHASGEPVQLVFDVYIDPMIERAEALSLGGVAIRIVTTADLIEMKERAASDPARRRSKALRDQADVALLRGDVPDPDEGW